MPGLYFNPVCFFKKNGPKYSQLPPPLEWEHLGPLCFLGIVNRNTDRLRATGMGNSTPNASQMKKRLLRCKQIEQIDLGVHHAVNLF